MLFRLPNGLAVEPVLIRKKFLKWQDAHPEFPRIVFHGLRHSSATYQLMISGGDVKAVQEKSQPCKNCALTVQAPIFRDYITKKNAKSYDLTFKIWCTSRDSNPGPTD